MTFVKDDPSNPKVGDKLFYIPPGAMFIVKVTVEEVYSQEGWTIETLWVDEPTGHGLYGFDNDPIFRTLKEAYKALQVKKDERKLWESRIPQRYDFTLNQYRRRAIKFIKSTGNLDIDSLPLKKKTIWR